MKNKVAVFCSGSGSNLQALLDAEVQGVLAAKVVLVISNRKDAPALERARRAGKEAVYLSPRNFEHEEAYARALLGLLARLGVTLVCLAGYLKKLPAAFVDAYAGRIVNIHPGPIPEFGGPGMYGHKVHEAVIASGLRMSGPTVHFVDEEYDHGPVIAHVPVEVQADDTPDTLAARVLKAEHSLYPRVVAAIAEGRIRLEEGRVIGKLDDRA
jgi:formyltetrahydrofolate-dependent phosphoribosylglycinamide formyltransferase